MIGDPMPRIIAVVVAALAPSPLADQSFAGV